MPETYRLDLTGHPFAIEDARIDDISLSGDALRIHLSMWDEAGDAVPAELAVRLTDLPLVRRMRSPRLFTLLSGIPFFRRMAHAWQRMEHPELQRIAADVHAGRCTLEVLRLYTAYRELTLTCVEISPNGHSSGGQMVITLTADAASLHFPDHAR